MAKGVCSEISSSGITPRISFSHDLNNTDDAIPVELGHHHHDSDFVFCITNGVAQKLSSADELFSNGKIVPTQINNRVSNAPHEIHQPYRPSSTRKKRLKEFLSAASDADDNEEEKPSSSSKYFWQFKRSSSLNCDATRGKSLLRSLRFLSRSYSTGSAPNSPKQTVIIPREKQKQKLEKQSSVSNRRLSSSLSSSSSSSASSSTYYFYDSSRKPSLKKNRGSCSGYGVRISPFLYLPQTYIPKVTASFFGFGSLFCNGKIKKKKK